MSAWERHPPAWQQQTWACSPARSPRFRRVSTTTSTPTSRNDKTQAVFFLLTFRGPRWPLLSSTLNSSAAMTSFPDQRRHHSGLMDIDPLLHISHRDKSPEDSGRELWARSQVLGRSSSLPVLGGACTVCGRSPLDLCAVISSHFTGTHCRYWDNPWCARQTRQCHGLSQRSRARGFTPWQKDMRKRTWSLSMELELLTSFHLGLSSSYQYPTGSQYLQQLLDSRI